MAKHINQIPNGSTFGHWTVLKEGTPFWDKGRRVYTHRCLCHCGTTKDIASYSLLRGQSKSCGCGRLDNTHGLSHTPEWNIWSDMKRRCRDPRVRSYEYYGARGITVCSRWMRFENFLSDMGKRPGPKYSLERKDNNGNYEPSNVVWATVEQQRSNNRRNLRFDWRGQSLTLTQISKACGIGFYTLKSRVFLQHMTIEEATSKPVPKRSPRKP